MTTGVTTDSVPVTMVPDSEPGASTIEPVKPTGAQLLAGFPPRSIAYS